MPRNYDGTSSVPQPKGQYVKSISGGNLYQIEEYGEYQNNRYWFDFDTQTLYLLTRHKYKIVKPSVKKSFRNPSSGLKPFPFISLIDINGKIHTISYNKFITEFKEMVNVEKE